MDITTITDKGQVTIPASLRKELGLKKGDKLIFTKTASNEMSVRVINNFDAPWHDFVSSSFEEWSSEEDATYDTLYTINDHKQDDFKS